MLFEASRSEGFVGVRYDLLLVGDAKWLDIRETVVVEITQDFSIDWVCWAGDIWVEYKYCVLCCRWIVAVSGDLLAMSTSDLKGELTKCREGVSQVD